MHKLSVIIPTYNEQSHIGELLEQLAWVDEILVIDSFSTDQTLDIAKKYDTKILQRVYEGPADQKNWAIQQAKNQWILLLDADERLTPLLTNEIKEILAKKNIPADGFWIKRQNYFMGKKIKYSGWQGDKVVRLIDGKKCKYNSKQVHEEIEDTGNIAILTHQMEHYTYKNMEHFLAKMQRYATWSALDYTGKTPSVGLFHLWIKPLFRFFKHYILKRGFLDGQVGFIISVIMAWGVFLRYVKIKESLKK